MTKLFVKICGMTRAQDAELAASLGASAVGFIFWPNSPRYVRPETARSIGAAVPGSVVKVGVFVDENLDEVVRVVHEAGLDAAQLHGHEDSDFCRRLKARVGSGCRIFKTIPMKNARGSEGSRGSKGSVGSSVQIAEFDEDIVLLVDAHDVQRRGGTGKVVNWDAAREIAAARPTILAGGLTAANVKLAVRSVRPYGIDVSSGVESSPGVKDPNRLRSFFEALHD